MNELAVQIQNEIKKVIIGKDDVIERFQNSHFLFYQENSFRCHLLQQVYYQR